MGVGEIVDHWELSQFTSIIFNHIHNRQQAPKGRHFFYNFNFHDCGAEDNLLLDGLCPPRSKSTRP